MIRIYAVYVLADQDEKALLRKEVDALRKRYRADWTQDSPDRELYMGAFLFESRRTAAAFCLEGREMGLKLEQAEGPVPIRRQYA